MAKGRIPDSDIQEIRERTPIEEIIGEYVQLKPAGADSLKGLSPFKDEKTPSFHVRPNHGYFHCFSSGEGGDVFTFLMKMEHVTFPEAVEICAEKIGYQIRYEGGTPGRRMEAGTRQRLVAANKAAHAFYQERLTTPEAIKGREFLSERGFTPAHAKEFGIGYAPHGWNELTQHLLGKGFTFEELQAAGLSSMGKRGPIDRFRRRLLWPIKNLAGDVIGFGARKLFDDDTLGKYMNTPETVLYKKSRVLFGLDLAKKEIAAGHQAVVVEGYTDVMAMHAAGVKTAVAACGTAFGAEHLQMLRRLMLDDNYFRGELIYTFDGDEAGQKAAMRAFAGDQAFTGQSYVAVAPEGMDPCDLRLASGDAAVRDLVARRIPMFEFVIRAMLKDFPLDSVDGRLQALRRTVPVVADIRDKALRREYARQLAGWVGWADPAEVVKQVESAPGSRQPVHAIPAAQDPKLFPQREALKIALQHPDIASDYFDGIDEDCFTHPAYRDIKMAIAKAGGCASAQGNWLAAVAQHTESPVLSELAVEEIHVDDMAAYCDGVLSRLQEARVGNQIAELKGALARMRPSDEGYNDLFADLIALEQARRELLSRAFR